MGLCHLGNVYEFVDVEKRYKDSVAVKDIRLLIYAVSLNLLGNILCRKALMKIKITGSLDTY